MIMCIDIERYMERYIYRGSADDIQILHRDTYDDIHILYRDAHYDTYDGVHTLRKHSVDDVLVPP